MRGHLPLLCLVLVLGGCKPKPSDQPVLAGDGSARHEASKGGPVQEASKREAIVKESLDEEQEDEGKRDTCLNEDVDKDRIPRWMQILSACEKPYPLPRKGEAILMLGVGGTGGEDVVVAGEEGHVLTYDGKEWKSLERVTEKELRGVYGCEEGRAIIVGEGVALMRDGDSLALLGTIDESVHLSAVWGTSCSDAYAVGFDGVILRLEGTGWSRMSSGTPFPLRDVWGTSMDDVYAVGWGGTILHCDGSSWRHMPADTFANLETVHGVSPEEIYAGGGDSEYSVLLRWNGKKWRIVGESLYGEIRELVTVSRNKTRVYWIQVFTMHGFLYGLGPAVRLSGGKAHDMRIEYRNDCIKGEYCGLKEAVHLADMWAAGDSLFAVGDGVWRYDVRKREESLLSAAFRPGKRETMSKASRWRSVKTGTRYNLNAVWGFSWKERFVVGAEGTILHTGKGGWEQMQSPTRQWLSDVWGTGPDDVYAVGTEGTILHYDGATWSTRDSGTDAFLVVVWGLDADTVFAAGDGVILRLEDGEWRESLRDEDEVFTAIGGPSLKKIVAIGPERAYRFNGKTWSRRKKNKIRIDDEFTYADLWAEWYGNVWLIGEIGASEFGSVDLRFGGWDFELTPEYFETIQASNLPGTHGSSPDDVYIVGTSNTFDDRGVMCNPPPDYAAPEGFYFVWDGEGMPGFDLPRPLRGVWSSGKTVTIVGSYGSLYQWKGPP